jgi:protein-disulfide isomerase
VELWVDESSFRKCLDSGKFASRVQKETQEWQSFWISGTPGNVLINNKTGKWDKLPGAYPTSAFKEKIDNLLK